MLPRMIGSKKKLDGCLIVDEHTGRPDPVLTLQPQGFASQEVLSCLGLLHVEVLVACVGVGCFVAESETQHEATHPRLGFQAKLTTILCLIRIISQH
eukprot:6367991-Amphidinium_carterae.1